MFVEHFAIGGAWVTARGDFMLVQYVGDVCEADLAIQFSEDGETFNEMSETEFLLLCSDIVHGGGGALFFRGYPFCFGDPSDIRVRGHIADSDVIFVDGCSQLVDRKLTWGDRDQVQHSEW
jgi:hypothetical protein